jgi:hypothetical protein
VLKQGKIFWFKSDIVTPVRPHSAHRSSVLHLSSVTLCPVVGYRSHPIRLEFVIPSAIVQDSIPRGVIEVRYTRRLSAKAILSARLLSPVWAREESF